MVDRSEPKKDELTLEQMQEVCKVHREKMTSMASDLGCPGGGKTGKKACEALKKMEGRVKGLEKVVRKVLEVGSMFRRLLQVGSCSHPEGVGLRAKLKCRT